MAFVMDTLLHYIGAWLSSFIGRARRAQTLRAREWLYVRLAMAQRTERTAACRGVHAETEAGTHVKMQLFSTLVVIVTAMLAMVGPVLGAHAFAAFAATCT
jgi:hypothetical protein